jgi:DnaJ-class molecular chaperone
MKAIVSKTPEDIIIYGIKFQTSYFFVVKKAYYKQSLKVHPDRVPEDEKEVATEKFQTLGKIYSILSDQEKKKIYDETGQY